MTALDIILWALAALAVVIVVAVAVIIVTVIVRWVQSTGAQSGTTIMRSDK